MKKPKLLIIVSVCVLLASSAISSAKIIDKKSRLKAESKPASGTHAKATQSYPRLRVLTLNTAHGRRDSLNQIFVSEKTFRHNLDNISQVLTRANADVVALQEIDSPSLWSGRFDHAATIAEKTGYDWKVHANHASSWLYNFGTAVLSRLPIVKKHSHQFAPSPPTLGKGFVIGQIEWRNPTQPNQAILIDVISVHLDFLSKEVQQQQIDEFVTVLAQRKHPKIVLGDFNSDWSVPDSSVREFARLTGLNSYHPQLDELSTYKNRRIDWILLSPEFEFIDYEVLPDIISDHKAVVAEIAIKQNIQTAMLAVN